jgi:glycosyltransferase involved in cell wall biosynthesis
MPKKESVENQKLVVSFLGYPTVDKGQEHILPIIQSVGKFRRDISWQVQITEDNVLKNQLDKLNSNIEILEGKISQPRLEEALSLSSVICLPYNVLAFKLNSSAMMYNSSDYLVPIITFEGSAFARDVSEFSCGLALKDRSDMIEALNSINLTMIQRWIDGCESYNHFRNQTNLDFLEIKKVKE